MTFTVNKTILAGRVGDHGVRLTYLPSGKPELTFSLVLEKPVGDRTYKTFIPVQVYGPKVEALAETLEPNDLVLVDGQLAYKMDHHVGGSTSDKRPSTLAVTCFGVEVLQPSETFTESA